MSGIVKIKINSPTAQFADDLLQELAAGAADPAYLTPIDAIKLYNAGTLVVTISNPTVTANADGSITVQGSYTNNGTTTINVDEVRVSAGTKDYFIKTTDPALPFTIAPNETKTIIITITANFTAGTGTTLFGGSTGQELDLAVAQRLAGILTQKINITGIDLITNTGTGYQLITSLAVTKTVDLVQKKITIQASYTPTASVTLNAIGVKVNGLTADPTGPSGYAVITDENVSMSAGVQYDITIVLTVPVP